MFNIHGLKARFDSISSSNVTGELNLVRCVGHNVDNICQGTVDFPEFERKNKRIIFFIILVLDIPSKMLLYLLAVACVTLPCNLVYKKEKSPS